MRYLSSILLLLFFNSQTQAQEVFEVAIVSDLAQNEPHFFEEGIKAEIEALLSPRFTVNFTEIYTGGNIKGITDEITAIFTDKQADVLIGAGIISSKILGNQKAYPVPSIASIQLVNEANAGGDPTPSTSGVPNYTYIRSPFNIEAGIETLQQICRCNKLAVLTNDNLSAITFDPKEIYSDAEVEIEWISLGPDLGGSTAAIPDDVGGVYVLSPLNNYTLEDVKILFDKLIERKLPSFSILDSPMLEQGAYASFLASDNLKKIPRRIAMNVEKIAEAEDPKDFPVDIETFASQLVVNMETVNKVGKFPNWKLLDRALLININKPSSTRILNLRSAIAEAIQNNLGYQIETKQNQISAQDVALAKSNYLPQLDLESTSFFLDENTVNSSFGTKGSFNWTAGASFSQLILSEPAMANIAIQKLLYESQLQVQKQSELDVILEVAQRFFAYLQVAAIADLQNNNIMAVNQNLTIASNKEKVGYSGVSDVYRWQTELDLAKTDLYETNAQLKAVRFQLNETLNRPIKEGFVIEESENIDQFIQQLDETFLNLIEDEAALQQLADFMVLEARRNLPELRQIELAIAAQERLLKSNKRAFYWPTVAFGASYNYPISTVNPGDPPPIPGFEANLNPTWSAAFNLSIPLFAGGARKYQKEKTEVGLFQLQDQQKDLNNLLELQVRANMEQVNASYNNIRLTRRAATAALQNIGIVQDLYKSGQINVITLVDAQNALLGAQINAANSAYQFMIDFFSLQRSVGNYSLLATEEQNEAFLQRFLNYKSN